MPTTSPTRPIVTSVTSFWKPSRASAIAADTPRSSSITVIRDRGHPNAAARSTSPYCNRVDSVCSRTCCRLDWRTYTIASRSVCSARIRCIDPLHTTPVIAHPRRRPGGQHPQHHHGIHPTTRRQLLPHLALGGSSRPSTPPHLHY